MRWAAGLLVVTVAVLTGATSAAAKLPIYHTPGYKGTRKAPARKPPAPLVLGAGGQHPNVFVDAAGTAHVVWNEPHDDGPDILRYCRVPRGAATCTASNGAFPAEAGTNGINDDDWQPRALAIGNQLLLLSVRFPNVVTDPDKDTSDTNAYLFVSNDGGEHFPGDPAVLATTPDDGGATIFGGADNPSVGLLGIYRSAGPFFQGAPSGQFVRERANLGDVIPAGGFPVGAGALATDGTVPIAAIGANENRLWIRRWTGTGDINNSATWSTSAPITGTNPQLAAGPGGVFLLDRAANGEPFGVTPVVGGRPVGARVPVIPPKTDLSGVDTEALAEDGAGRLTTAWVDQGAKGPAVRLRRSSDGGRTWDPAETVATGAGGAADDLDVAAAPDGGGFTVYTHYATPGAHSGKIEMATFGTQAQNGQPGLGALDNQDAGGPGDTTASLSCREVDFGAVRALAQTGCFLRDPKNPQGSAGVTSGAIRLNGLDIVPDTNVKIVVDPRHHTLNTTGSVHVYLRAPVVGQVEIWHGELHINLPQAGVGTTIFDFDTSDFAAVLKGFPINGHIQVILEKDAVRIPITISLPPALGGISGDVTLLADNTRGLHVDTLHIHADDLFIGPLEINPLNVSYHADNDEWDGDITAYLPTGGVTKIGGSIRFVGGRFKSAGFVLGQFPGIPLFADVWLHEARLGLAVDPLVISGGVSVGFQPIAPPSTYLIDIAGDFKISFSPLRIEVTGVGSVLDIDLAHVGFVFNTDPLYARADLDISLGTSLDDCSLFNPLGFELKGSIYAGEGHVGGIMEGGICFFGATPRAAGGISDEGIAVCVSVSGGPGIYHKWGDSPFDISYTPTSCYLSSWAQVGRPAGSRSARAAGNPTYTVASGSIGENIRLTGATAPPNVTLLTPGGQSVTPAAPTNTKAPVVAGSVPAVKQTVIGLRHPQAGTWTIVPAAGSSAITLVEQAHSHAPPSVKASVTGRGRHRRLVYSLTARPGLSATFAERIGSGEHTIGTSKGARGTIAFAPGDGPGGRRKIFATISEDGAPREHRAVGSYVAPPPVHPRRVRGLSAKRHGSTLVVRFKRVTGAAKYVVRVALPRRVVLLRTTRKAGTVRIGRVPRGRATVSVYGLTATGRSGPVARVRVAS